MTPNATIYRRLYTIRRFEETVLENFAKGVFFGTTHTYLGQEANAVGVLRHLQPDDIVFSNHRCHGHFLAYGGALSALFAEMMGKSTGVCGGRGGSQHLQFQNFYSNGVQGGIVPVATGMALAEKFKQSDSIAICFIGDGTLGQGVIYESFNMAALWGSPILYVLENNQIAQTTRPELALAGGIAERFAAFGVPVAELDTADVLEIDQTAGRLVAEIRADQKPRALILHTCRFGPHSKGDDTRPAEIVAQMKQTRDPITIQANRLDPGLRAQIDAEVNLAVSRAFDDALAAPLTESLASPRPELTKNGLTLAAETASGPTVLARLNQALHTAAAAWPEVVILGEDILDPYGGAFKLTRGLSTTFPNRVWSTPISEAGFVGIAAGMALRGMRPVVEIMFGDFITLAADQIINHIAKFRWMYNQQVQVPVVIRTPMGGRRGYGPTHSQTLEKLLLGVPGLRVVAPHAYQLATASGDMHAGQLLLNAIQDDAPVIFIENKLLYLAKTQTAPNLPDFSLSLASDGPYPAIRLQIKDAPPPDLTIAAYGYMAELGREAILTLAYEYEIFAEMIVFSQLSPFELDPLTETLVRTGRLLVLEEGTQTLGWGAEVLAQVAEQSGGRLKSCARVTARDLPVPASGQLENEVLPQVDDIIVAVQQMNNL